MVERRIELDRRYQRKKKMRKLKTKLETATGADRDKVLAKIKRISPWWTEGGTKSAKPAEKAAEKAAEKPAAEAPAKKPKAPPKPKAEKKPAP